MQSDRETAVRLLRLSLIGSLVIPILLFAYAAWFNYQATYRAADERIERSLAILHEHSLKIIQSTELALYAAADAVRDHSDQSIRANEKSLHDELQQIVARLTQLHSVWIFDRDGKPLVASSVFPVPQTFTNSDRDYFQAQVARDAGTYIGRVVLPRVAADPIFTISQRRPSTEGQFTGVTAAGIWPRTLQQFYGEIANSPGLYYALLRSDGAFLARHPIPSAPDIRLNAQSQTMRAIAAKPDANLIFIVSQLDGVGRRLGYRKLAGYPVYLLAGVETRVIRNEWLRNMASHLIFGIPATALLFGVIALALRRTERLYAEAERREQAEATLRQLHRMEAVGQLTGGVAHDFNNLLTIVLGNLESAKRQLKTRGEEEGSRLGRSIDNAIHGAQRGARLTQRLLAFSRRQPLAPQPLNFNKLLSGMSELVRQAAGERIDVEVVAGAGLWNAEADPAQLETTILNLVLNARDAMPDGGKLTLETANAFLDETYAREHGGIDPGQYASLAVTDTGIGMDAEVQRRAFEPFFTTKSSAEGTGLGLSQVYGFIKQSGGHVKIYSEAGHGTTVKLYLPRVHAAAEERSAVEPSPDLRGSGERILVVEDDAAVRGHVLELLQEMNYTTSAAENGDAALELFGNGGARFDLLLTDVVLPGLNGRQLADEAKKRDPALKVLFMTGYSRNAIVHHGRLDPGVHLLQKPFTRDELGRRIREMLNP
jgi:two-component system NtrC family sensor kinase